MGLALIQWMTALSAVICLITVAILRRMDPEEPSLRLWAITVVLLLISTLLGGVRDVAPSPGVIIAHNVTAAMGGVYLVQAMRVLLRLPRGPQVQWLVGVVYGVVIAWFVFVHPQTAVRLIVGSLYTAAVFGYCAWLLHRHREPGLKVVLTVASAIAALLSIGYVLRAGIFAVSHMSATAMPAGPTVVATYIAAGAMWTAITLLIAYVVATRTHIRLAEAKGAVDEANLRLLENSWVDSATQVTNRSRIAGLLSSGLASRSNFGVPLAVALVSVEDSSRPILDPRTVDPIMAKAAGVLRKALGVTGPDFETIGRWGDDAFLILLNGLSREEAVHAAQRLAAAMQDHAGPGSWDCCRIGVTMCAEADSPESVLDRLYEATYGPAENRNSVRVV